MIKGGNRIIADSNINELRGRTLKVYVYVIKEKEPVGPRDVMRSLNFSSPSVAYRHLQKLETMGLIKKNTYGNYVVKEKISMRGFVWFGRRLIPNALVYAFFFLIALIWEVGVFMIHFSVETNQFKIFFLIIMIITITALVLFIVEGLRSLQKIRIN